LGVRYDKNQEIFERWRAVERPLERLYQHPWSWVMPWDTTTDQWMVFFNTLHTDNFATSTPPALPSIVTPPSTAPAAAWYYTKD
jgi:hypothetical protein